MKLQSYRAKFFFMLAGTALCSAAASAGMLHRGTTPGNAAASGALIFVLGLSMGLLFLAINWVGRNTRH